MTLREWQKRRVQLRRRFRTVLGKFPRRTKVPYDILADTYSYSSVQQMAFDELVQPAEPGVVRPDERPDNPTYRRFRIRYPGVLDDQPVTAFLRIPKDLSNRAPAALCLHGHVAGSFFGKEYMDALAIELTLRGFVTLASDMLPFGERRDVNWEQFEWDHGQGGAHFWGERTWFQTLLLNGQTLQGLHVWELQRALDVLASLPDVDAQRIGCAGFSGGGINALWLAAMDERVTCTACCCGVQSYHQLAQRRYPVAVWGLAPVLPVGDSEDLISLIAPRPFLGIEGAEDAEFNADYNREHVYPPARKVYSLYGPDQERLVQHTHPGGHQFASEQRRAACDWLQRWLLQAEV